MVGIITVPIIDIYQCQFWFFHWKEDGGGDDKDETKRAQQRIEQQRTLNTKLGLGDCRRLNN